MDLSNVSRTTSGTIPNIKQTNLPIEQKPLQTNEREDDVSFQKKLSSLVSKELNDFIEPSKTSLKFQLHDKLNEYYVQIIDTNTDEVLKEIPSKKFLDRYAATAELLGFLVDHKI